MHGPHNVFDIGRCTVIQCDAEAEKNRYSFKVVIITDLGQRQKSA